MRWLPPYASIAGLRLSEDDALSLSTVWACIDVIAKNIAACRWNIYEPVPGTKRRKLIDNDIKAWLLNTRPNPEMTAIGFREALLFQAIPFGNAYAEIVKDRGGRVSQLWPLSSERVTPRRDPATWELFYEYRQPGGEVVNLSASQVLHIRGPGMHGLMGDNVVARAAKTLALMAAQERFSLSFFGQGGQPIGVIQTDGVLDDPTFNRLKKDWEEKYKGPQNAFKPLILEAGMKFNAISVDPQKAQLTEDKKFTVEEICRWFGVPPHKVQHLEHATFSNIEHSSIEFVRDALQPWALRLSQEADAKLLDQARGPWRYTEIDVRPLTLGDAASRANAQASWRQNGVMSANEIRAMEGLDDVGDDGDVLLVQANLTTVENIINPPQKSAPASPTPPNGEPPDEGDDLTQEFALTVMRNVFNHFARRVKNRAESIKHKENAAQMMAAFKLEQVEVVMEDLAPFKKFIDAAIGRALEWEDVAPLVMSVDVEFNPSAIQLPTQTKEVTP